MSSLPDAVLLWSARAPRPSSTLAARLALGAAVASGAATLIYELCWLRALTFTVGATFPAITVVLTTFMFGLGIGSLLGGRLADRGGNPLIAYAKVEVLVLVVAAGFPVVSALVGSLALDGTGPFSGRAFVAGLALLPATTLMGTTFPLLSAALHENDEGARHIPRLYGANTLGAGLGAVLGGLLLPFALGVSGTLWVAGGLNLTAALLALVASRGPLGREARPSVAPTASAPTASAPAVSAPTTSASTASAVTTSASASLPPRAGLLLVLSAGSGALIMLAELFWTRVILQLDRQSYASLAVEPSDAMTMVLVLVLLGNAVGSLLATRLDKASPAAVARIIALTWVIGGVSTLMGLEWVGVRALGLDEEDGGLASWAVYLRLLPVFPPAILLGMGFPLLARVYSGALSGHGARLGSVWWANTLGAVVGSVGGGWWLLPLIGADRGLVLCAVLSLVLAGVAVVFAGVRARDLMPIGIGAACVGLIVVFVPLGAGQLYRLRVGDDAVIATWEGWEATTIVWSIDEKTRMLTSNGRTIPARANLANGGFTAIERNPTARRAVLVGFGTGIFAQGVLRSTTLEELVIVEIDGAQFKAAEYFDVKEVVEDPRVRLVVDDALHFLATSKEEWDMILIDAWGPDVSPALYTAEFAELARSRLSPNGALWAKVNPLEAESLQPVKDALRCTFPAAYYIDRGEKTSVLFGMNHEPDAPLFRYRLTPADSACDPLRHMYPRRLHTDYTADTAEKRAPGGRPAQGEGRGPEGTGGEGEKRGPPPI